MSTAMLRTRRNSILVLCLLIAGLLMLYAPLTAASARTWLTAKHPWQQDQLGLWSCQGTSTLKDGTEQFYAGRLTNAPLADPAALSIWFEEEQSPTPPFREHQGWIYVPSIGTHLRILVTNDGSYGLLFSDEPHANIMEWDGPFVTPEATYHLSETLTRISSAEYQWYGVLASEGQQVGYYRLTCTKFANET